MSESREHSPYEELHHAAEHAISVFNRLVREGGVVSQWAAGEWDDRLDQSQAQDLADRLRALAAQGLHVRAQAGGGHTPYANVWDGPLPFNRKERFYTGTVLPMVVASDGFAHLHRFLGLCGLEVPSGHVDVDGGQRVQFLTEYGFAESVYTDEDKESWPEPATADTPDVVIAGPDWLVAVEAKMFHNPSTSDLRGQYDRQAALVDMWRTRLGLDEERVRHVLLLPARLAEREADVDRPVVTWEAVLREYSVVAPRHWTGLLNTALARHEALESHKQVEFRANAQAVMTGAEIVAAVQSGAATFDAVGRHGGRYGKRFTEDVHTGGWPGVKYEVRTGGVANRNWFTLDEFLQAVGA